MPIRGGWYIKGRVQITEYRGVISDDEFLKAADHPDLIATIEASPAPLVHFIFNADAVTRMPSLRVGGKPAIASHPKVGWIVVVRRTQNPVFKMIASILGQMTKLRVRFVNSEAEAIEFLHYVDSTLPELPDRDEIEWFNYVNWEVGS